MPPLILWFRRDLRLDDNPMLAEAARTGRPLIPVFIADDSVTGIGAAARWRWGEAVEYFAKVLYNNGLKLVLRRGEALTSLRVLIAETGAGGVWWTRLHDPQARERDGAIKAALRNTGIEARSFPGHLLCEPGQVATAAGGPFRVYTPFWKAVTARPVPPPVAAPLRLTGPAHWPASDRLSDWALGAGVNCGAAVLARHACIGEEAALQRLERFMAGPVEHYREARDLPGQAATSGLSENLTYGEIGPRRIWAAAQQLLAAEPGHRGAGHFCKELVWREFAHHLIYHNPELPSRNWRPEWDDFPWRGDSDEAERWRRGVTGEPFVDAGLREMYVTGRMHNRARMIVASYLTKHLMTHWKIGLDWFADCLTDWDPAANAMGWQWVAGSGPDAAPYFRIFNPALQGNKYDSKMIYRRKFIAEISPRPNPEALDYFAAAPRTWKLDPGAPYPPPMVDLAEGRDRALAAYSARRRS